MNVLILKYSKEDFILMSMPEINGMRIFNHANRMIDAYHAALLPLSREAQLPPVAIDILLFLANNEDARTASDISRCRGWKPGIVSVHAERLVSCGLLTRVEVPGDRRKTLLRPTEAADGIIRRGRAIQRAFGDGIMCGIDREELEVFRRVLQMIDKNLTEIQKNGLSGGKNA